MSTTAPLDLMNTAKLAEYLSVSPTRARELMHEYRVPHVGWGRTRRWRRSVIDAWLDRACPQHEARPERRTTGRKAAKRDKLPTLKELLGI